MNASRLPTERWQLSMSDTTTQAPASFKALAADDSQAGSRMRRSVFCFGTVIISLCGVIFLGRYGSGVNAEHAVDGLSSLAEVVAFTYLGVSTVDRSGLLSNIGQRVQNGPTSPTPPGGT